MQVQHGRREHLRLARCADVADRGRRGVDGDHACNALFDPELEDERLTRNDADESGRRRVLLFLRPVQVDIAECGGVHAHERAVFRARLQRAHPRRGVVLRPGVQPDRLRLVACHVEGRQQRLRAGGCARRIVSCERTDLDDRAQVGVERAPGRCGRRADGRRQEVEALDNRIRLRSIHQRQADQAGVGRFNRWNRDAVGTGGGEDDQDDGRPATGIRHDAPGEGVRVRLERLCSGRPNALSGRLSAD